MIGLPEGWETTVSEKGKIYYYHVETRETRWTPPPLEAPNEWLYGGKKDELFDGEGVPVLVEWKEVLRILWGRRVNLILQGRELPPKLPSWNMLCYLFHHLRCGIYCLVVGGELKSFIPFAKKNYANTWDGVKLPTQTVKELIDSHDQVTGYRENIIPDVRKWWSNGGTVCNVMPKNVWAHGFLRCLYSMVQDAAPTIGTHEFFINRNHPVLRKNLREPYANVFGGNPPTILKESHLWMQYARGNKTAWEPVFATVYSFYTNDQFQDKPMPVVQDWFREWEEWDIFSWEFKLETAFFRGSATGYDVTPDKNPRLKLATLSEEWNDPVLNAKLTSWDFRYKFGHDGVVRHIDPNNFPISANKVYYVPMDEQSIYKYLLYLPGNVGASRLGALLSTGSLVLVVESSLPKVWLMNFCKPWVHYVPVDETLCNLKGRIAWCMAHDEECAKIAAAGKAVLKHRMQPPRLHDMLKPDFAESKI